jgi:hypothetical protein
MHTRLCEALFQNDPRELEIGLTARDAESPPVNFCVTI